MVGVATITHGDRVFRFRTDPNSIKWDYTLNTKVEETYGGRVVQILSAKVENLSVTAHAGNGRWEYMMEVIEFFRDLLVDQRNGIPAEFSFPTRNYKLKVFATALPFRDQWDAVAREFTMTFKVQEDTTGVMSSSSISAELSRLKEGIGFQRNDYNYLEGPADTPANNSDPNAEAGETGEPSADPNASNPLGGGVLAEILRPYFRQGN